VKGTDEMELVFDVIAIKDHIGYASDFEKNGLFEVDIESGECKFIKTFPNEDIMVNRLHGHAEWIEGRIYFIPSAGNNISVFYPETTEIETIEIPRIVKKRDDFYNLKLKFVKSIVHNGFLWIIPATYPGILKLNLNTHKISLINNWVPNDGYMFRRGVCVRNNIVYAASGNNNSVLIFDVNSEKGEIVHIGKNNFGMMDMCEFGGDFIMAPRKQGAVVKWNPGTSVIEEYREYPAEFVPGEIVFQCVYRRESQIICVPAHANCGIILNEKKLDIDNEIQWKIDASNSLELMYEHNNKMCFREYKGNQVNRFYYIDKESGELSNCCFIVINPDERLKDIALSAKCEIIKESKSFGLQEWINAIV
jgi:hypothetical protein